MVWAATVPAPPCWSLCLCGLQVDSALSRLKILQERITNTGWLFLTAIPLRPSPLLSLVTTRVAARLPFSVPFSLFASVLPLCRFLSD
jgi:hypothetical protein